MKSSIPKTLKATIAAHSAGVPTTTDRQYRALPSGDYHTDILGMRVRLSKSRSSWVASVDDQEGAKDFNMKNGQVLSVGQSRQQAVDNVEKHLERKMGMIPRRPKLIQY